MAHFKFVLWLGYWYFQNEEFEFEWDRGNLSKSRLKHGVTPEEIESVFDLKMAIPLWEDKPCRKWKRSACALPVWIHADVCSRLSSLSGKAGCAP